MQVSDAQQRLQWIVNKLSTDGAPEDQPHTVAKAIVAHLDDKVQGHQCHCAPLPRAVFRNLNFFLLRTAPRTTNRQPPTATNRHPPPTANRHQPPTIVQCCFCGFLSCPCLDHETESVAVNVRFCWPFRFFTEGQPCPSVRGLLLRVPHRPPPHAQTCPWRPPPSAAPAGSACHCVVHGAQAVPTEFRVYSGPVLLSGTWR